MRVIHLFLMLSLTISSMVCAACSVAVKTNDESILPQIEESLYRKGYSLGQSDTGPEFVLSVTYENQSRLPRGYSQAVGAELSLIKVSTNQVIHKVANTTETLIFSKLIAKRNLRNSLKGMPNSSDVCPKQI